MSQGRLGSRSAAKLTARLVCLRRFVSFQSSGRPEGVDRSEGEGAGDAQREEREQGTPASRPLRPGAGSSVVVSRLGGLLPAPVTHCHEAGYDAKVIVCSSCGNGPESQK